MNPSASGWINKFGHLVKDGNVQYSGHDDLYAHLLENGFVYGVHLGVPNFIVTEHPYTEDEVAKANLLTALYFSFIFETGKKEILPISKEV